MLIPQLINQVNQAYNISAIKLKPHGSVWRLESHHHSYLLKRIRGNPLKYSQLAKNINDLYQQGFKAFVPILPTKTGAFYFQTADQDCYFLSPWLEGKTPDFLNIHHLKIIGECFGELHSLNMATFPAEEPQDCLTEYQQKLAFLESIPLRIAQINNNNRIDRTVLKWRDYFLKQAKYCVSQLAAIPAELSSVNKMKGFCHNDPAPGNIIIQNQKCCLFDFEFAGYDYVIKEFILLTLRALQTNHWNPDIINLLKTGYQVKRALLEPELKAIPYLLCFPRRFWRFCRQRYAEKLAWTEKRYQNRLWEIIAEEKDRQKLINTYMSEQ